MTEECNTKSPNESLAEVVASALIEESLIPKDREDELKEKLVVGTARAEDWRLWAELSVEEDELSEGGESNG